MLFKSIPVNTVFEGFLQQNQRRFFARALFQSHLSNLGISYNEKGVRGKKKLSLELILLCHITPIEVGASANFANPTNSSDSSGLALTASDSFISEILKYDIKIKYRLIRRNGNPQDPQKCDPNSDRTSQHHYLMSTK